jgi:hypothetical protein
MERQRGCHSLRELSSVLAEVSCLSSRYSVGYCATLRCSIAGTYDSLGLPDAPQMALSIVTAQQGCRRLVASFEIDR